MGGLVNILTYTEFITSNKKIKFLFFKFVLHIDILLIILVLLLPCNQSNLSLGILKLVHILPQQFHTSLSFCSVNYVNYLVRQFELFFQVFGHCRYQHWCQTFLSSKIFCCNDKLIAQSHKLVKICLSYCKILDQSELFVVVFLQFFKFYIQVVGIIQICLDICQSPHSRYKLACTRKQ